MRELLMLGAVLLAMPAGAQEAPPPGPPASAQEDFAGLHNALHLSPAQEPAWAAYRAAAPSPGATEQRRRAAAALFPTLESPRRIDLVEAEMRQELLELQRQSKALKGLYAALSPEQQRVFDERTLPPDQRH